MFRVNGDPACRLPNTSNLSFQYIEGEAILYHLSDLGICASSGSACTSDRWSLRMDQSHGRAVHLGARLDTLQSQQVQH